MNRKVKLTFYFYPSDELSLFQLIFIVRSYGVLLYHCHRLGEGLDPANMFNSTTFCMYVPVHSQEPKIQWLSFGYVLHIWFLFKKKMCTHIRPLVFSFGLFYIVISGHFIADYIVWALLIVEGHTVTYSC